MRERATEKRSRPPAKGIIATSDEEPSSDGMPFAQINEKLDALAELMGGIAERLEQRNEEN